MTHDIGPGNLNQWYNLAVTFDENKIIAYIDGVEKWEEDWIRPDSFELNIPLVHAHNDNSEGNSPPELNFFVDNILLETFIQN